MFKKTKNLKRRTKLIASGGFIFLIIAVLVIWQISPAVKAAVTVDTSTSSKATAYSSQHKTWYDGTRYWAAYSSGTNIQFRYSTDQTNWTLNSGANISSTVDGDFDIWADSGHAFIIYTNSGGNVLVQSANSYPGTGFTWTSNSALEISDVDTTFAITLDSSNQVWIGYINNSANKQVKTRHSSSAYSTSFGSADIVNNDTDTKSSLTLAALASGDMLLAYKDTTTNQFLSYKRASGTWDASSTLIAATSSGDSANFSMLGSSSANKAYATYIDSSGKTKFNKYVSGTASWTTSYSGLGYENHSMIYVPSSGKLIAGYYGADMYECDTATDCDASGDWTVPGGTFPSNYTWSLALDNTRGYIYAGMGYGLGLGGGSGNSIYRCPISSSCTGPGGSHWTNVYSGSEDNNLSIVFDSTHGVFYAGTDPGGIILRCDITTNCDATGDWTTSNDTTETSIYALAFDSTHGILYAGTDPGGKILRCDTTSLCDAAGDWTTSYDTTETSIYALTFDSTHGILYAGSSTGGIIYRCDTTSLCDAAGDWTTSNDTTETSIKSLTYDTVSQKLYAGTSPGGLVLSCATSSLCDASGDWSTSYDSSESAINSIAVDTATDSVYAGSETNGNIYRLNGVGWQAATTLDSNSANTYTTISQNTTNNNLYAMWMRYNDIFYKKNVGGTWDTNPTTRAVAGTNNWLSSALQVANPNSLPFIWTAGTASLYSVKYDSIATNSGPSTPSHTGSSPGNGSTVLNTTQTFQVTTTDPDSDSLKYHIKIFNGTGQSGGLCTGSLFEERDGTSSQGNWNASSYSSGATASYTNATAFTKGNSYCWQVRANDYAGSISWSSWSTPWTFTVNGTPAAPTLTEPASGQAGVLAQPYLRMAATDPDSSDYLKYAIQFCGTDSSCATQPSTYHAICQYNTVAPPFTCSSASQSNWYSQSLQSNTAYSSGQTAVFKHTFGDLAQNTTYYWRAYAIDPGGTNTWSSASSIFNFTTVNNSTSHDIEFRGGTCFGAC